MKNSWKSLVFFGLFLMFIGLAMFSSEYNSMLINLSEAGPRIITIFKLAFLVIAFGFLFAVVLRD